jgi:hypothetical protein
MQADQFCLDNLDETVTICGRDLIHRERMNQAHGIFLV